MKCDCCRKSRGAVEVGAKSVGPSIAFVLVSRRDGERCAGVKMPYKLLNGRVSGDNEGKMNSVRCGRRALLLMSCITLAHQATVSESKQLLRKERRCLSTR